MDYEAILAAQWANVADRYEHLPRWKKAQIIAAYQAKMQLDAVLAYQESLKMKAQASRATNKGKS